MARKKAKTKDYKYINCTNEAIGIAKKWFRDNRIPLHAGSLYIVWFAYTKNGYRCMVQSNSYDNIFFEIIKNMKTKEMVCRILQQVECIVHPSQTEAIIMHERTDVFFD